MKKLAILMTVLMLLLTTMAPAMAVDITVTNSDHTTAAGSTFQAYRLLDLTTSLKCTSEEVGHVHTDKECYRFSYTVNETYRDILLAVTGKDAAAEDADIVAYIAAMEDHKDPISAFADSVYKKILDYNKTAADDQKISADYESANGVFADAAQGYYLIVETAVPEGEDVSYSKAMLDTKGALDVTVKTKKSIPTVSKEVEEINNSTDADPEWKDAADHDIGDTISFRLTGTLPTDYATYASYAYEFVDTLTEGLTVPTGDDGKVTGLTVVAVNKVKGENDVETEVETTIDAGNYAVTYAKVEGSTDTVLKVSFADLKTIENVTIDAATKIVVKYSAVLNEKAKIGADGNPNEVYLNYSNNPYGAGTGKTEEDKVIVYTFETVVNKVGEDEETALEGAGFTLYKWDAEAKAEGSDTKGAWVQLGDEIKSTEEKPVTTFTFTGLDAGIYKLVETTVPDGYNKAADLEFKVVATYTDGDPDALDRLVVVKNDGTDTPISTTLGDDNKPVDSSKTFVTNKTSGTVSTTVVNTTGVELPATGGIGTTIFYVAGGLLVLAALALLLARRSMHSTK